MKNFNDVPIHDMFGLSYSNYLVLPRSILQSMPVNWQKKFVKLIDEMEDKTSILKLIPDYIIYPEWQLKNLSDISVGELLEDYDIDDVYSDYCRGSRNVFEEKELKK